MFLQAFGIGQEGLSNEKFFNAISNQAAFDNRIRKLNSSKKPPVPTIVKQVFCEDTYSLTNTFLTLTRSVAYTAHKLFRELSENTRARLELTKALAIVTLPLSASHLYTEWSKERSFHKMLHVGVQISNLIEALGMVLEATYAVCNYTGQIVRIADLCGAVSTIGGSALFYTLDVIALINQHGLEKKLDTLAADQKYKDAFRNRLHALNRTRYFSMATTTLYLIAYAFFTRGTANMIGCGWICMSLGAVLTIGTKIYQARALNQFMKATSDFNSACVVS